MYSYNSKEKCTTLVGYLRLGEKQDREHWRLNLLRWGIAPTLSTISHVHDQNVAALLMHLALIPMTTWYSSIQFSILCAVFDAVINLGTLSAQETVLRVADA